MKRENFLKIMSIGLTSILTMQARNIFAQKGIKTMDNISNSSLSLLYAIQQFRPDEAIKIIQKNPPDLDLNARDKAGYPAILTAINVGEWGIIKELLLHGANIWIYASSPAGANVGWLLQNSYPYNKGPDKQWIVDFLKSKNYPWPAPGPWEMPKLVKEGKWPPEFVTAKEREDSQLPLEERGEFLLRADPEVFDQYLDIPKEEEKAFIKKHLPDFPELYP